MSITERFKNFLKKYFFNPKWRCLNCGKEIFEGEFCSECKKSLPRNDGPICAHCGRAVLAFEQYCSTCKNVLVDLDLSRSCFTYAYPINKLIKRAKYDRGIYLIEYFAKELAQLYFQSYFK